jgi:diguanylate cyclase (GGDEF)-like protein
MGVERAPNPCADALTRLEAQSRILRAVVDALPVGLMVFDADLRLRYWNRLAFAILDLPETLAVEGALFADLIRIPAERGEYGPGDPAQLVAERVALARQFQPHRLERRRPDGRCHLVQGEPFYDENGQPAGFVSTFTDITSLKETETALNVTVDRLQTLIDHLPSAVTLFDGELRLVAWNRQLLKLLDFPPELIAEGVSLEQLVRYNIARGEYGEIRDPEDYIARFLEVARHFQPHEFERVRPNGQVLHIVGQPVPSGGFVTIYTDVTRQRQVEEELQRLAIVDELTGLANRTALLAQLPRMCQEARRRHERLAVLLVDLDRFKWINDSAGHEAGDQLLQEAARRITSEVRSSDLAARLGGDEFAIVAPSTQLLQVADLAERLLAALAHPFTLAAGTWQIGASIGIALFPDDEENASALLRAADLAMRRAKGEGGNTYLWPFLGLASVLRSMILAQAIRPLPIFTPFRLPN